MALIVQKYGGTSVADPDRMRAVAENVQITKRHGNDVVVVVSAMGKATDNLIALASQVSGTRPGRVTRRQAPKRSRQTASAWASMTSSAVGSSELSRRHSGPSTNMVGPAPVRM